MKKHKQRWLKKVYRELCKWMQPENDEHRKNIREYASAIGSPESAYLYEGMTPKEAVDEEMSCA